MFGIDDLASGLVNVGASAIGADKASKDRDAALAQIKAQIADLEKIGIPSVEAQKRVYQQYQSAGKMTPELETALQQAPSEMNNIALNPQYADAKLAALGSLKGISDAGGMNLTDKANLANIQNQTAATAKGSRDAILQNMRARGAGGSGMELAAQLSNAQNAASNDSTAGLNVAAQAQARALAAIQQQGSMGNQFQQTDFSQAASKAAAQDAINKFNTQNSQSVQAANVAAKNNAQAANLANQQAVMNANTTQTNKAEDTNKGLLQTQFNNQLGVDAAKGAARNGVSAQYNKNADNTEQTWQGIGQGAGEAISAYGQANRAASTTAPKAETDITVGKSPYDSGAVSDNAYDDGSGVKKDPSTYYA